MISAHLLISVKDAEESPARIATEKPLKIDEIDDILLIGTCNS